MVALVILVMDDVGGCIAVQSRISFGSSCVDLSNIQGRESVYVSAQYLVEANELQQLMTLRAIGAFVNVILCALGFRFIFLGHVATTGMLNSTY